MLISGQEGFDVEICDSDCNVDRIGCCGDGDDGDVIDDCGCGGGSYCFDGGFIRYGFNIDRGCDDKSLVCSCGCYGDIHVGGHGGCNANCNYDSVCLMHIRIDTNCYLYVFYAVDVIIVVVVVVVVLVIVVVSVVLTIVFVILALLVLIVVKLLALFRFHGLTLSTYSWWSLCFTVWKTHYIIIRSQLIRFVLLQCALIRYILIVILVCRAINALRLMTSNCHVRIQCADVLLAIMEAKRATWYQPSLRVSPAGTWLTVHRPLQVSNFERSIQVVWRWIYVYIYIYIYMFFV